MSTLHILQIRLHLLPTLNSKKVKKDRFDSRVKSYYFLGSQNVRSFYFFEGKGIIDFRDFDSFYTYNVDYIKWYQKIQKINIQKHNGLGLITYMNVLDRKTLKLKRVTDFDTDDPIIEELRCKVEKGLNSDQFKTKVLNLYKNKYQNELEQIKQKNKI